MNAEAHRLLEEIVGEYREILGEKLVGLYAHGSLAFGCFNWAVSDIDFLAVVKASLSTEEKMQLLSVLMERTNRAPEKGFEMSVVKAGDIRPFVYPTPFELHFSNTWLEECRKDMRAYCSRPHGGDPDLAAHCTVMRAVGVRIEGPEIEEVFGEVPRPAYLDSIRLDVESAGEDVAENPVYVILNLCRVLAACEGIVLSKADGGRWGLQRLDARWHGLIQGALSAYTQGAKCCPDEADARAFAAEMLAEIGKKFM